MRNSNNLDERQLYLRGNAFMHGLCFMGLLLFLDALLKSDIFASDGIVLVEGMWGNILIIIFTAVLCQIEVTLRCTLDFENKSNSIPILMLGAAACVLFIWGVIELFVYDYSLLTGNSLSKHSAQLLMDIAFIINSLVYIIKKRSFRYPEE